MWTGGGESKIRIFVDVINGWPLMILSINARVALKAGNNASAIVGNGVLAIGTLEDIHVAVRTCAFVSKINVIMTDDGGKGHGKAILFLYRKSLVLVTLSRQPITIIFRKIWGPAKSFHQ